ncbi:MAG TPA: AMP-binding protein [Acidimicrobiales bacterium]|nr:AMP-binding protein [Acidimicrobiales bacterium]
MNLATILEGHPDGATALLTRGRSITYGELRDQVAQMRGGLVRAGVERGDRVAIVAANNRVFVVAYLAILGVGAVAVPLNPGSPSAELRSQLSAVDVRIAIVGPSGRDAMAALGQGSVPVEQVYVAAGVDLPGGRPLDQLLGGEPAPVVDTADDDLAVLIFTAGTAGAPRAAMLSHGNLRSNLEQVQAHPSRRITADDVTFGVLPTFHIFGLNVALDLALFAGSSILLVERFDPASALDSIRDHGVTVVAGAPPMYQAWVALPEADPAAFSTVRIAVSGAAPLPPAVAAAFEQRFGVPVHEGYGLTEASPVVTSSVVGQRARHGSIGVPVPGVEVRLVDADGEDALAGDEGEIWVRGPNVFKGYWGDAEATAAAITPDGWLRTGDVAVVDGDGFLYIVDRVKDLIIVSGFNVYPAEVEEVLRDHPGIDDVAVVGMPHPHSGETVKAFVVQKPGFHLEEDQVIEFCAGRLARYKCPTKVTFVDELPVSNAGKLLRRELRAS